MNINEELIKACVRGDQRACKQLYDFFSARMYAICLRYTRTDAAAQDVLHDGFIKVFEKLHTVKDSDRLYPWMRSIMINTAITNWYHEHKITDTDPLPDSIENDSSSPSRIFSDLDIHIILDAVRQLPPAYRMAFNLCEIEGYDYSDAAEVMGVNPSTVRSNLTRAKQILAQKLAKYYPTA